MRWSKAHFLGFAALSVINLRALGAPLGTACFPNSDGQCLQTAGNDVEPIEQQVQQYGSAERVPLTTGCKDLECAQKRRVELQLDEEQEDETDYQQVFGQIAKRKSKTGVANSNQAPKDKPKGAVQASPARQQTPQPAAPPLSPASPIGKDQEKQVPVGKNARPTPETSPQGRPGAQNSSGGSLQTNPGIPTKQKRPGKSPGQLNPSPGAGGPAAQPSPARSPFPAGSPGGSTSNRKPANHGKSNACGGKTGRVSKRCADRTQDSQQVINAAIPKGRKSVNDFRTSTSVPGQQNGAPTSADGYTFTMSKDPKDAFSQATPSYIQNDPKFEELGQADWKEVTVVNKDEKASALSKKNILEMYAAPSVQAMVVKSSFSKDRDYFAQESTPSADQRNRLQWSHLMMHSWQLACESTTPPASIQDLKYVIRNNIKPDRERDSTYAILNAIASLKGKSDEHGLLDEQDMLFTADNQADEEYFLAILGTIHGDRVNRMLGDYHIDLGNLRIKSFRAVLSPGGWDIVIELGR